MSNLIDKHNPIVVMSREKRLPQWAQKLINNLRQETIDANKECEMLKTASAVLYDHNWFTINGPNFESERSSRTLWVLDKDSPVAICDLGKNDILLVGRASKKQYGE